VLFEGGAFSLPRHAQLIDLSPRTVRVTFAGDEALRFTDRPADATLEIRVRPNKSAADVLAIARSMGAAIANDAEQLGRRLDPQLREAAQRCAAAQGVSSLADGSFDRELTRELGKALESFAVDACHVAPGG
jgi:hypothetical protein